MVELHFHVMLSQFFFEAMDFFRISQGISFNILAALFDIDFCGLLCNDFGIYKFPDSAACVYTLSTVLKRFESNISLFWHLYIKIPMSSLSKFLTLSQPRSWRSLVWSATLNLTFAIALAALFCNACNLSF